MAEVTFTNCKQALDYYSWRHDLVLFTATKHLKPKLTSFCIYANFLHLGFPSQKGLFSGKMPDMDLQQGKKLMVIELT